MGKNLGTFHEGVRNFYTVDSSRKYEQRTHRCLSVAALKSLVVLTATCGSAIQTGRTVASSGQQFNSFY
jgi:hypothetical protein